MNCNDILKALNSDNDNLELIEEHLRGCSACAKKYESDLELEKALQGLTYERRTIDIADEVTKSLYISKKRNLQVNLIRRWVWVTASLTAIFLLLFTLPDIIKQTVQVYNYFDIMITKLIDSIINTEIKLTEASIVYKYLSYGFHIMIITLTGIILFLWREFRAIIH